MSVAKVTVQGVPEVKKSFGQILAAGAEAEKRGVAAAATVAVNQQRASLGNPLAFKRAKGRTPGRLAASMRVGKPRKNRGEKGYSVPYGPMSGVAGSAAAFAGAKGAKGVYLYRAVQNAGDPGRHIPAKHYIERAQAVAEPRMYPAFVEAWTAHMKSRGLA